MHLHWTVWDWPAPFFDTFSPYRPAQSPCVVVKAPSGAYTAGAWPRSPPEAPGSCDHSVVAIQDRSAHDMRRRHAEIVADRRLACPDDAVYTGDNTLIWFVLLLQTEVPRAQYSAMHVQTALVARANSVVNTSRHVTEGARAVRSRNTTQPVYSEMEATMEMQVKIYEVSWSGFDHQNLSLPGFYFYDPNLDTYKYRKQINSK